MVVSIQKMNATRNDSKVRVGQVGWGLDSYVQQPEESPLVSKHLFHPMNRMPPPELYYNSKIFQIMTLDQYIYSQFLVTALRDLRFIT